MSQSDFGTIVPTTKSGSALATDLMSWRNALHSSHKGPTAPSYVATGLVWLDDAPDPLWLYKIYDGTSWITMLAIDSTNNVAWTVNPGEKERFPLAGGTANALTLTPAVAMTAYADMDVITFEAASNNSAAVTLNVSAVGAKAIRKMVGGADAALVAGDILDGVRYFATYDTAANAAAGAWILVNPSGSLLAVSTDAGATGGPDIEAFRDSASPAASDVGGRVLYTGRDSAGNKQTYAIDQMVITDPTSGSEDAKRVTRTVVAGTEADRHHIGAGAWMEGATGGDPGAGNFNAAQYQQNGAAIPFGRGFVSADQALVAGTNMITVAHGLGVVPATFMAHMKCVIAEQNYAVNDQCLAPYNDDTGATSICVMADATNLYFSSAPIPRLRNKSTGNVFSPTAANWRIVLKAFAP